jgi:hypothetical protein
MRDKVAAIFKNPVLANIVYAQLSFFLFLTIAAFMTTQGFKHNRGLSFYGEHWSTAVPYGVGFFLCVYFLLRAANALPKNKPEFKRMSILINILTILLLGVLLTPDTLNSFFNWSHIVNSSILFIYELFFAIWLTIRCYRDKLVWFLLFAQFIAGVFAMLSQFHIIYYLSEGTLFFQLFFSVLLIYSVARFMGIPKSPKQTEKV